jgi:hypothetical protein
MSLESENPYSADTLFATKEAFQAELQYAREILELSFRLRLSVIQGVGLRRCLTGAIERLRGVPLLSSSYYGPGNEAVFRFITHFFDITPEQEKTVRRTIDGLPDREFNEFLQWQDAVKTRI